MMKLVKLELVSERDITEYLIGLAESLSDWLFYYTIVATSRRSKLHLAVGNETNSFEWNNRCYGILFNVECIKHISVLIKEHNSYNGFICSIRESLIRSSELAIRDS